MRNVWPPLAGQNAMQMKDDRARYRSVLFWIAAWSFLFGLTTQVLAAPTADDITPLKPEEERVFYLPIAGTGVKIERLREKEVAATVRFFRQQGVASAASLIPATGKELFIQVEPSLTMALYHEACAGREKASLSDVLARAQARSLAGDFDEARRFLAQVRAQLPCAEERLTRTQMAELFIWSGLTHEAWPGEPALAWLRTGLGVDPEQVHNPRLPYERLEVVKKAAYELDRDIPRVDLHMPQDEGLMWALKNLTLDGRRLVFEKLFVQLTPGMHYLQLTLPNERTWGTFIELEAGTRPDLAEEVRRKFGIRERFTQDLNRLLFEGFASPAFADGLKLYLMKLKRERLFFSALTEESDGSWVTARQVHLDGTVSVPALAEAPPDMPTASLPVVLSQPYTLDFTVNYSGMLGPTLSNFRTPGSALELDIHRLVGGAFRVGLSTSVGARAYQLTTVDQVGEWTGALDVELGLLFGRDFSLGNGRHLIVDGGYRAHLMPLQGIPVYCGATYSIDTETGLKAFDCGAAFATDDTAYRFNLSAIPHGPRVRVGIELRPFFQRLLTMRTVLRVGYSPLLISLQDRVNITLTTSDTVGSSQEDALLFVADDARSHWLHQMDFGVGINGTY